jgi:hypothetical protein
MTKENWIAIGGIVIAAMTSAIGWLITWKNANRALDRNRQASHPLENRRADIVLSWRGDSWAKKAFFIYVAGTLLSIVALVLGFIYAASFSRRQVFGYAVTYTVFFMYSASKAFWPYKP